MQPLIVGIRFQRVGKIYHFDASSVHDLQAGDFAVVETSRGRQLGEVVQIVAEPQSPPDGTWKPIQRRATPRDLLLRQLWQRKELEAMITCRAKSAELNQKGVKIVAAEYTFDGSRLSFLYSTETEEKIDLRALRNAMQRSYPRSRVEMRLIGPRDVAKLLGGMGACGFSASIACVISACSATALPYCSAFASHSGGGPSSHEDTCRSMRWTWKQTANFRS